MGSEDNDVNISRSFLVKALEDELELSEYKIQDGTKPGDNFMSLIYSVEVKGKNKDGKLVKRDLLLKCYPVHPTRQNFNNKSNIFYKELEIYRLWIPELRRFQTEVVGLEKPISLPYAGFVSGKCIDYSTDEGKEFGAKACDPLDNYIIMDDLRPQGYIMTNRRDPFDIDHLRLVILELAKVHALSWAYKGRVEQDVETKFPCLKSYFGDGDKAIFIKMVYQNVDSAGSAIDEVMGIGNELTNALKNYKETTVDKIFEIFHNQDTENEMESLLRIKREDRALEPWRILCHGDCWSNNMLFKYDEKTRIPLEVILVDLQMVRQSCVMIDLVYCIYACTDVRLRKHYLAEIQELYVNTFNNICCQMGVDTLPGFNLENFKYRFHRYKLLGLLLALSLLPIMLKEAEEAPNMENMGRDKDLGDMFSDVCKTSGTNTVYTDRILELVREMYEEGVI